MATDHGPIPDMTGEFDIHINDQLHFMVYTDWYVSSDIIHAAVGGDDVVVTSH